MVKIFTVDPSFILDLSKDIELEVLDTQKIIGLLKQLAHGASVDQLRLTNIKPDITQLKFRLLEILECLHPTDVCYLHNDLHFSLTMQREPAAQNTITLRTHKMVHPKLTRDSTGCTESLKDSCSRLFDPKSMLSPGDVIAMVSDIMRDGNPDNR
jgi:hypothetical protein